MHRVIYEERLFSRWSTLLLGLVTVYLFWQLTQQPQPASGDSPPAWLIPAMALLFVFLTFSFAWLTIRITDEAVVVAYGVFRRRVTWEQILDCYPDEASVARYGGWGIRLGWYNGKRRLIYNTAGDPRVVLSTTHSRFPELVFSTARPDDVVDRVREHQRTLRC